MIFNSFEKGADDFAKRSSRLRAPVFAVLILRYIRTNGERARTNCSDDGFGVLTRQAHKHILHIVIRIDGGQKGFNFVQIRSA